MAGTEECSVQGCERLAEASLDDRSLCREHFISGCYLRLDACAQLLLERPFQNTTSNLVRQFVTECTSQARLLAKNVQDLNKLERARLLDIVLCATERSRHLRRSPRKVASIPMRLRCEEPGRGWEEDTHTVLLSRYGAALECQHPVEIGQRLLVLRTDTGQRAHARVVLRQRKEDGNQEIGVEFPDCDNFWGLDWSEP